MKSILFMLSIVFLMVSSHASAESAETVGGNVPVVRDYSSDGQTIPSPAPPCATCRANGDPDLVEDSGTNVTNNRTIRPPGDPANLLPAVAAPTKAVH